jgi:hypothetical protein
VVPRLAAAGYYRSQSRPAVPAGRSIQSLGPLDSSEQVLDCPRCRRIVSLGFWDCVPGDYGRTVTCTFCHGILAFPAKAFYGGYVAGLVAMGAVMYLSSRLFDVNEAAIPFVLMFASSLVAYVIVGSTVCRRFTTHLIARDP